MNAIEVSTHVFAVQYMVFALTIGSMTAMIRLACPAPSAVRVRQ